jgi:hypothetical protein
VQGSACSFCAAILSLNKFVIVQQQRDCVSAEKVPEC